MAQATTVTPLDHLVKVLELGEPSAYRKHTYINGESMTSGQRWLIAQSFAEKSPFTPAAFGTWLEIAAGDIRQDLTPTS